MMLTPVKDIVAGQLYNLRDVTMAHGDMEGWVGRRKDGRTYYKLWRGGSVEFIGGPKLAKFVGDNPNIKAYLVKKRRSAR